MRNINTFSLDNSIKLCQDITSENGPNPLSYAKTLLNLNTFLQNQHTRQTQRAQDSHDIDPSGINGTHSTVRRARARSARRLIRAGRDGNIEVVHVCSRDCGLYGYRCRLSAGSGDQCTIAGGRCRACQNAGLRGRAGDCLPACLYLCGESGDVN
jgi:hypothetical protein